MLVSVPDLQTESYSVYVVKALGDIVHLLYTFGWQPIEIRLRFTLRTV